MCNSELISSVIAGSFRVSLFIMFITFLRLTEILQPWKLVKFAILDFILDFRVSSHPVKREASSRQICNLCACTKIN